MEHGLFCAVLTIARSTWQLVGLREMVPVSQESLELRAKVQKKGRALKMGEDAPQ
jgi:hypothetical protein